VQIAKLTLIQVQILMTCPMQNKHTPAVDRVRRINNVNAAEKSKIVQVIKF